MGTRDDVARAGLRRMRRFLDAKGPPTPCLVLDLATVAARFRQLRNELPETRVFYAVKANPTPAVLALLAQLGAEFEVASPGEIRRCLEAGIAPAAISYTNTIKKRSDVAWAYAQGVRLFTVDSAPDLATIAEQAPGSDVICRLLIAPEGAKTPFGHKFGCSTEMAIDLLTAAVAANLRPRGVSFHVGSQQLNPAAWGVGIAEASLVFEKLSAAGITLDVVNLGGGLPATYLDATPRLAEYAGAIRAALDHHFGASAPTTWIEPGRFIAADAGLIRSEVVLAAKKHYSDEHRWIYLDVGRYSGLAETENEAITYRLETSRDGEPTGPVIIAGPSADGDDVLYQRTRYDLPLGLRAGDRVDLCSTGAYTATYASVFFNGFAPLPVYCLEES